MNKAISSFAKTFLAVFFIAATTISCSEDDIPPLAFDDLGEMHMKFTYNGTVFNSYDPITTNLDRKTIDATYGTGAGERTITLVMPLEPTVGTHFFEAPTDVDVYAAYFTSAPGDVQILADSGTITITHVTSDYIKGTFNFSGPNGPVTVNITEGSFMAEK